MSQENINITITGKFEDELTAATTKAKSSLSALEQTTKKFAESSNQGVKSGGKVPGVLNKIRTSAAAATTRFKAFATALPGVINGLGNVASSAVMLHRSYRDLTDTQIKVDRATLAVSKANEAVVKAQTKVNDLIAEGKQGTPEYEQALLDLAQAQDNVKVKTDLLGEAQEAQSDAYQDFTLSIVPGVLGVLGTLGSVFMGLKQSMDAATAAQKATATATNTTSTAMKALRVAMVAIPLVALATALLAVKTNAGGFRDMLNELGEKIGNLIPQVKPLLQWIKDFAEALGLTEKAMDLSKAWDLLVSGFKGALEKIRTTDWKAVINTIVQGISDYTKNWNWDDAWSSFVTAFDETIKFLGPILEDIGALILKTIESESPKWWKGFQLALTASLTWVSNGIRTIGAQIANTIVNEAAKWWVGFQNQLGKDVSWVGAQLTKIGKEITSWATWEQVGKDIWASISKGISDAVSSLGATGGGILDGIQKFFDGFKAFADKGEGGGMFFTPFIDTSMYTQKLNELKTLTSQTTLAITSIFSSMSTSIQNTLTTMATKFASVFIPLQTNATAQVGATITVFTNFRTSVQQILGTISAFFPGVFAGLPTIAIQATTNVSASFLTMATSIKNNLTQTVAAFQDFASSITSISATAGNGVLNSFVTPASNGMKIFIQVYTATAKGYEAFASSINKSSTNASASVLTMRTSMTNNLNALKTTFSTFVNNWNSSMKSMTASVKSFASATVSAMNNVASAAKKATSALNAMAAAARKAAAAKASAGLMHGGSFVRMAQHGFSGVINSPTSYGGVRMGEGFQPEFVTVSPMKRGSGNTGGLNRAMAGNGISGGGGTQITNVTVVLDGRVIQRFVEKTALGNYSNMV